MPKRDLNNQLSKPVQPQFVEGRGYTLSTETPQMPLETATAPQVAKEPSIQRVNAKIDPDLLQEYKLLAVKQKRPLYEIMEEALREWLQKYK